MVSELQVALGGLASNRLLAVAAQVFWLVLAFTQDHPGDRYSVEFRDACERAAVEGYWVEPPPPPPPPSPQIRQAQPRTVSPGSTMPMREFHTRLSPHERLGRSRGLLQPTEA